MRRAIFLLFFRSHSESTREVVLVVAHSLFIRNQEEWIRYIFTLLLSVFPYFILRVLVPLLHKLMKSLSIVRQVPFHRRALVKRYPHLLAHPHPSPILLWLPHQTWHHHFLVTLRCPWHFNRRRTISFFRRGEFKRVHLFPWLFHCRVPLRCQVAQFPAHSES